MKWQAIFFLFLLCCTSIQGEENCYELLKKAVSLEKQNKWENALELYQQAAKSSTDTEMSEWLQLKIARIVRQPKEKLLQYHQFISTYPNSKFINLAYYETASLYFLLKDYQKALDIYSRLLEFSYGTPYFTTAALYSCALYLNLNEPDKAIQVLHILLEDVSTDEETAECYFFLGKAYLLKQQPENAAQNFSICVGTFGNTLHAERAAMELKNMGFSTEGLSLLSEEKKTATNLLENIEAEIKESLNFTVNKTLLPRGLYLQLGSYTEEKNAVQQIELLKKDNIENLHLYQHVKATVSLYKIIMGPFSDKIEANKATIDLKDHSIDAFLIEIPEDNE